MDIDLTVEAVSTDGGMAIASVLVEVSAVAEAPHLEVSDTGGGVPPGDDQVIKGSGGGGDVLDGGGGDDIIRGGGGDDVIHGDPGGQTAVLPLDIEASWKGPGRRIS